MCNDIIYDWSKPGKYLSFLPQTMIVVSMSPVVVTRQLHLHVLSATEGFDEPDVILCPWLFRPQGSYSIALGKGPVTGVL